MSSLADVRPGDLMFTGMGGAAGFVVGTGQLLLAVAEPGMIWRQGVARWWRKRHVGVVVEASRTLGPAIRENATGKYTALDERAARVYQEYGASSAFTHYPTGVITAPRLVQAMPGGAEEIELTAEKHWTSHTVFLRPRYITADPTFALDMPGHPYAIGQAQVVADAARGYLRTPYDFATYAAIPAWRRGLRTERIKRIISGTDTMMCSRLADAALRDAGWHAFADGRLPGDVTPSELYRRLLELPHTLIKPGG